MKDISLIRLEKGYRDPTPKYYRLQALMREKIEKRKWAPGEVIPTEQEVARAYNLSLSTVRKAMANLVNEGYLYRLQGKGTFVSGNTIRSEALRSYRLLRDFDRDEAALRVRLMGIRQVVGPRDIRRHLRIRKNQNLYEVKRVLLCLDRPLVFSISHLPVGMFKGLESLPRSRIERTSMYALLEGEYGVTTVLQKELFSATQARDDVAVALGVEPETPLLVIDMVALTYKQRPYEYRVAYCLTDTHRIYREK